jgi:hypothetical protein
MGKTWSSKNRRDEKDFIASLRKGKTVYVISEPKHAGQAHLWNHARTWSAFTVTGRHPLLGGWVFNGDPSNGAKGFLGWHGTVYEDQPRDVPHHSDAGPDVRDEGYGPSRSWATETRRLDPTELKHLSKREAEAKAQYDEDRKAKRRSSWF